MKLCLHSIATYSALWNEPRVYDSFINIYKWFDYIQVTAILYCFNETKKDIYQVLPTWHHPVIRPQQRINRVQVHRSAQSLQRYRHRLAHHRNHVIVTTNHLIQTASNQSHHQKYNLITYRTGQEDRRKKRARVCTC